MIEALEGPCGQGDLPHHLEAARRVEMRRVVGLGVAEAELPRRICRTVGHASDSDARDGVRQKDNVARPGPGATAGHIIARERPPPAPERRPVGPLLDRAPARLGRDGDRLVLNFFEEVRARVGG